MSQIRGDAPLSLRAQQPTWVSMSGPVIMKAWEAIISMYLCTEENIQKARLIEALSDQLHILQIIIITHTQIHTAHIHAHILK